MFPQLPNIHDTRWLSLGSILFFMLLKIISSALHMMPQMNPSHPQTVQYEIGTGPPALPTSLSENADRSKFDMRERWEGIPNTNIRTREGAGIYDDSTTQTV